MRLDHLLSKEQLAPIGCPCAGSEANVLGRLAHGWNIDIGVGLKGPSSVRFFGGWNGSDLEGRHMHAVGS